MAAARMTETDPGQAMRDRWPWQAGHAASHLDAPFTHDDFRGLLEFRDRSGVSGLDRLLGR